MEVYFPADETWIELEGGERIEGGQVRTITRTIEQLPVWGRVGHVLCLGRAVQHTGEIDLHQPIEEVIMFGEPRVSPVVMNKCVTLRQIGGEIRLNGVTAQQCRPPRGYFAKDDAGQVLIARD